ncbi:MAG TPA: YfiR family protein [Methylomirabilota bacterium]|nr:YfiR family protein [Methylomirabilota bacterium]
MTNTVRPWSRWSLLPGGLRVACALLLLSLSLAPRAAVAQSPEVMKAAFIFNFAKLTEWPATAFADDKARICVGFVGAAPMADTFEKAITGKNANGREFEVKRLDGAAGAEACHIVFVGEAAKTGDVIGQVKGKPVLTISDADAFAGAGGMIGFLVDGGKIGFELNLASANAVSLKFNDKLKQLAKTVKGG